DAGQNVDTLAAERLLGKGVRLVHDLITFRREHGGQRAVWIVNFDWNQSRVGPVKFKIAADHLVEFGPGALGRGRWGPGGCAFSGVVRIGGGVNAGQTLSTFYEFEKRLPAGLGRRLVVRIVQKLARGAVKKQRIILLQIVGSDRGGIVTYGRHPRAGPVS